MNTTDVKAMCVLNSDKVEVPSINDYIHQWVVFCNKQGIQLDKCLWKNDIEGAFAQLRFRPEFIHLLATRVDDDMLFLDLCGVFGWTNMLIVFGVLSRCLSSKISLTIKGVVGAFVDDFVGCSLAIEAMSDQLLTVNIIRETFNVTAINDSKSIRPTIELDVIGWTVNLEMLYLCLNEKDRFLPVKVYQLLASLA